MKICVPTVLKDIAILVIFPPLWVILKEIRSSDSFPSLYNIILNIILTSMFYFPGLIHAMTIMREEGPL